MKFFNDIFYLEFADLAAYGVSQNTMKSGCLRNRDGNPSWSHINDPEDNRKVLIVYDSIPSSTIQQHLIPSKKELLHNLSLQSIKSLIQIDLGDKDFYLNNPAAHSLASEYSRIAAWLRFCASQKGSDAKNKGFENIDALYTIAMKLMEQENFKTWRVGNLRVFKRRLQPFNQLNKNEITKEEALDSIICQKFGKDNAAKLGPDQKSLLIQLYSDTTKPNFEQVYTIYLKVASQKIAEYKNSNGVTGWSEKALVSLKTIKNYLTDESVMQLWYHKRHGMNEWRTKFDPIIKRQAPSFANALWVMDGTPWHRYYMDGKTAYARLNIFPILDAYSWCVIGFAVDYSETSDQVVRALQGACERSGVVPYQLQYDNSAAIKSYKVQNCIEKLVKYNTATQVGNARAKIIEPFFRHFNDQILKFRPGYAGSNITAKKIDSHANREELMQLVKLGKIPTLQKALEEFEEDMKLWNNKPFKGVKSPLRNYRESFEATRDKQRLFTEMMRIDAFWDMPGKLKQVPVNENGKVRMLQQFQPTLYTFSNSGIRVERKNTTSGEVKRFDFDVEDAHFRAKNINKKFSIKYDPEKMDRAFLYDGDKIVSDDKGRIVVAYEKTVLSMAIADRKPGEGATFHRLNDLRKQQYQLISNEREAMIEQTKLAGTFTPVTHDNLYPKEVMNAVKASQMEQQINEGGNITLPEKTKSKRVAKTNLSRFETDDAPEFIEINKEESTQQKQLKRWE